MKYAISRDISMKSPSWSFDPWRKLNCEIYDSIEKIPDDRILIASHFAPWWTPLKEYITEGRPWIEIEYGYWGSPESKKQKPRRVTYCGYHNLKMRTGYKSRAQKFDIPVHQPWRQTHGDYVIGILPIEEILMQRTGENIIDFQKRLKDKIKPFWSGEIKWRNKIGSSGRFFSFVEQLKNAHAVVGERTMACTEACLLGVPGYTLDPSMSSILMGSVENLCSPAYPDRTLWWEHICQSQFDLDEFATAVPAEVTEQYQIYNT